MNQSFNQLVCSTNEIFSTTSRGNFQNSVSVTRNGNNQKTDQNSDFEDYMELGLSHCIGNRRRKRKEVVINVSDGIGGGAFGNH